jgi:hypothetical protein
MRTLIIRLVLEAVLCARCVVTDGWPDAAVQRQRERARGVRTGAVGRWCGDQPGDGEWHGLDCILRSGLCVCVDVMTDGEATCSCAVRWDGAWMVGLAGCVECMPCMWERGSVLSAIMHCVHRVVGVVDGRSYAALHRK